LASFFVDIRHAAGGSISSSAGRSTSHYTYAAILPLFKGLPHMVLYSLVKHFAWFCENPGISNEPLSSMLSIQHSMLPPDNNYVRFT